MSADHGEHGLGDDARFDDAWNFVIKYQGAQTRKPCVLSKGEEEIPYTVHLKGAARRVLDDGGTPEEAIGALLHDVVEDTPVGDGPNADVDKVREEFGDRVAEIVHFCTDAAPGPGEVKDPWRKRKEDHFRHLRDAGAGTLRVVAADKTDNITGQIECVEAAQGDPARIAEALLPFKGGFAGTLWYQRGMRAAMRDALSGSELHERLGELIVRFSRLRTPDEAELTTQERVRMCLDGLDPRGVGPVQIANGHYSIDAYELARRSHVPGAAPAREVVDLLVKQWYGSPGWSSNVRQAVVGILAGGRLSDPS